MFGVSMWRSLLYGVLMLPAGIVSLLMTLSGAHQTAARLQHGLAVRWHHLGMMPRQGGYRCGYRWRRGVDALLGSMIGVLCWLLVALAGPNTIRNVLLYPLTDRDGVARAWGGPTLAGAWAVHAALALLLLPVELSLLQALTGLRRRLAVRLLDQSP